MSSSTSRMRCMLTDYMVTTKPAGWQRVDRWFFVPMSPRWLAVLRIGAVFAMLYMLWPPSGTNLLATPRHLDHIPHSMWAPVSFTSLFFAIVGAPSDAMLDSLRWIATGAGVLVAVGLFTRTATAVCALAYLAYTGMGVSFRVTYSLGTPLYLLFLLGPFLDWGAAFSLDQARSGKPVPSPDVRFGVRLRAVHAMVGLLFFFAAVTKVANCGMQWVAGGILARYTMLFNLMPHIDPNYTLWAGEPRLTKLAEVVIKHPAICKALELNTLLFEGLFFVSFFWRRAIPLFLLGAIGFHISIHLTIPPVLGIPWLPVYIACVASYFASLPAASTDDTAAPRRTVARWTVIAVLVVETGACFLGIGEPAPPKARMRRALWPFLPQVMFSWKPPMEGLVTSTYQLLDDNGQTLATVTQPMLLGSRITSADLSTELNTPALAEAAARYRCEHGPREATQIAVTEVSWSYPSLIASYDAGTKYVPTSQQVLRTASLRRCP